jgi:mono/diheme cytochrome c family protein
MYHARTMCRELQALLIIATSLCAGVAQAADVQAGRSAAQSKCSQCHEADDWEGEDAASLESLIRDIVAGKVKHKGKLELSSAEIANIAAYWGQGKK